MIRPAHPTDTTALVDLYRAEEQSLTGQPATTAADIKDLLNAPGLNLATNSAVMIEEDQLVGLVLAHPAPQPNQYRVQLAVHPTNAEHIARELLTLANGWLPETTTTLFQLPGSRAQAALRADGWEVVHSFTRLIATLTENPRPKTDVRIGTGDMRTVHKVIEDAMQGHWNHQRRHFADFLADQERRDGHDPSLWLLAERAGEPAGAIVCRAPADRAWVGWLGVLPAARRSGVGAALLGDAFAQLYERGHRTVGVDVDTHNETGAARVYERAGMRALGTADQWRRP